MEKRLSNLFLLFVIILVLGQVSCHLKKLSRNNKKLIKSWNRQSPYKVWQVSGQFEGDIILSKSEWRNGVMKFGMPWPRKEIPYKFDYSFPLKHRRTVEDAIRKFNAFSCLRFRPYRFDDVDHVTISRHSRGCSSHVGRKGGQQMIFLAASEYTNYCVYEDVIHHMLMHTAGFEHQHSAVERDDYVTILWQNINKDDHPNFCKRPTENFGIKYDYQSIMHFDNMAFGKTNTSITMIPKQEGVTIGGVEMTYSDKQKLNVMYGCRWENK